MSVSFKNISNTVVILNDEEMPVDINGSTSLHLAAAHGLAEMVRGLLDKYSTSLSTLLYMRNNAGCRPIDCAILASSSKCVALLKSAEAIITEAKKLQVTKRLMTHV